MLPDSFSRKDNPNTPSRMGRCSTNGDLVWYSFNQHDTNNNVYNQDNHDDKANHNYYKNNHHADHHHHQQSPNQSNRRIRQQRLHSRYRTRELRRPVQLCLQIWILSPWAMYVHRIRSTSSCAPIYWCPWGASSLARCFVSGIVQFWLRPWVLSVDCVSGCLDCWFCLVVMWVRFFIYRDELNGPIYTSCLCRSSVFSFGSYILPLCEYQSCFLK